MLETSGRAEKLSELIPAQTFRCTREKLGCSFKGGSVDLQLKLSSLVNCVLLVPAGRFQSVVTNLNASPYLFKCSLKFVALRGLWTNTNAWLELQQELKDQYWSQVTPGKAHSEYLRWILEQN